MSDNKCWEFLQENKNNWPAITTRLSEMNIVDVREPEEFNGELGHLPGACLAPIGKLHQCLDEWEKDIPILVVCRSGRRAESACATLTDAGFGQVFNLCGGMLEWLESNLHNCLQKHTVKKDLSQCENQFVSPIKTK